MARFDSGYGNRDRGDHLIWSQIRPHGTQDEVSDPDSAGSRPAPQMGGCVESDPDGGPLSRRVSVGHAPYDGASISDRPVSDEWSRCRKQRSGSRDSVVRSLDIDVTRSKPDTDMIARQCQPGSILDLHDVDQQ